MPDPRRSFIVASLLFLVGTSVCYAQQSSDQPRYLELSWMHVKQDKVAEFNQLAKRIADANRRGKGDHWVAYMDFYGRDNNIWMGSARPSLADVETAGKSFMAALQELMDYTPDRFFAEVSKTVESSGSELMRYRFDLSWNVKNADDWAAQLAKAKYVAAVMAHVKPGHMLDAEKQLGMLRDAILAHGGTSAGAVTQLVMGGDPGTLLIRIPLQNVSGLAEMPSPRSVLGEEGYKQYSEMLVQNFASFDYSLKRLVPEWSNPPDSFVQTNPEMWSVKPSTAGTKAKKTTADKKQPAPAGQ